MISYFRGSGERGGVYVAEQTHGSGDDRGAELPRSGPVLGDVGQVVERVIAVGGLGGPIGGGNAGVLLRLVHPDEATERIGLEGAPLAQFIVSGRKISGIGVVFVRPIGIGDTQHAAEGVIGGGRGPIGRIPRNAGRAIRIGNRALSACSMCFTRSSSAKRNRNDLASYWSGQLQLLAGPDRG